MVKILLEQKAVEVISQSLASGSISNWNIYDSGGIDNVIYPLFAAVMNNDGEVLYKENVKGLYKVNLAIVSQCDKTTLSHSEFNRISDIVFNKIIINGLPSDNNLKIHDMCEANPAMVESMNDGWTATKTFNVICERLQ